MVGDDMFATEGGSGNVGRQGTATRANGRGGTSGALSTALSKHAAPLVEDAPARQARDTPARIHLTLSDHAHNAPTQGRHATERGTN